MKSLTFRARLFILSVSLVGMYALLTELGALALTPSYLVLAACCLLAAPLQVLKIEGVTARTSYNLGWIVYGFAFINLGTPAAMLVVLVAHLVEWVRYRYPWYIQTFNVASFSIAFWLTDRLYRLLQPGWSPPQVGDVLPIILVFALLTFLNHLLIGCAIYLARNQSFAESGVLAPEAWLVDFGLLGLGVVAAVVWLANPGALLFVTLVVFMLYRALLVPALRRQTEVDPKTNVYNMAYFGAKMGEELSRAQRSGHPLTIVMADLDHLREVNNVHGHLAGDLAIQSVAGALRRHSRSHDIVARFGGEEFAILMPDTRAAEALGVVEAMRRAIAKTILETGAGDGSAERVHTFQVTMSFGVAELPNGGETTVKELVDQADQALYMAKHLGRNRACLFTRETCNSSLSLPATASEPLDACAECSGGGESGCVSAAAAAGKPMGLCADDSSAGDFSADSSANGLSADDVSATITPVSPKSSMDMSAAHREWALGALVCAMAVMNGLLLYRLADLFGHPDWIGIAALAVLAAISEVANVEIYAKHTSVSTSAAALLGGSLLFGPVGVLLIGASIAIAAGLKYRSPLGRFCFNANNHVLGGLLCVAILAAWGKPLLVQPVLVQVALTITCAVVLYLSSTALLSVAMSLSTGQRCIAIWAEKFRWLGLHYIALGFVAYGLLASYPTVGPIGIVAIILPLAVVRYGQKQYIAVTEAMVRKLQQANQDLVQQKQAVEQLNGEMLTLLAAALDLRDPSVQSHCEQVSAYATAIAAELNLPQSRIEQVRRAALLHDIGKLAVPDSVLYKAAPLDHDEYAAILQHPVVGAQLLERFSSLHPLADFVRHHHEHFDGSGYPDGLHGEQIPLEARIVGLADAVEAMASERPYQRSLPLTAIRNELRRCCGTQFDPQVVTVFLSLLEGRGDEFLVDSARRKRCWQSAPPRTMQPCMPAVTN